MHSDLSRRRSATIAGYARVAQADPTELAEARQRGAAARGAQLRGDSSWGKRMSEARRLKRYGAVMPSTPQRINDLERRIKRLEAVLEKPNGRSLPAARQHQQQHKEQAYAVSQSTSL